MKRIETVLTLAAVSLLPFATTAAFAQQPAPTKGKTTSTMQMTKAGAPTGPLIKVNGRMVCMVNNKAFDKPQMPVTVKGRTYYGCCNMCRHMLQTDAANRMAVDPISKKKVDKSKAVIGKGSNDAVKYFQNDADLQKYNAKIAGKTGE